MLYNRDNTDFSERHDWPSGPLENVDELMSGKPSIPLDFISDKERRALMPR